MTREKTNLLEAIYYPVLFRSVRGAPDHEVARFKGPGFQVQAGSRRCCWTMSSRRSTASVSDGSLGGFWAVLGARPF